MIKRYIGALCILIGIGIIATALFGVSAYAEPANTYVYVSNYNSGTVSVINPVTYQKITDIKTDRTPSDVIVNPTGTYLYVCYDNLPYVDKYSTYDYSLVSRITLDSSTAIFQNSRMAMSSDGTRLYITNMNGGTLYAVDAVNNIFLTKTTYSTPSNPPTYSRLPSGIVYHNGYIYVSLKFVNSVIKIDPATFNIVNTYTIGISEPTDLTVDSVNDRILVYNSLTGTITYISLAVDSVGGTFAASGSSPYIGSISVNSTGNIYKTDKTANSISVFNANGLISTVNLGSGVNPLGIACNLYNNTVFVTGNGNNRLYVIDGLTVLGYIPVGVGPYRISIGTQAAPPSQIVQFRVQSFGGAWIGDGIPVNIYLGDKLLYTGVTDDSGVASFALSPTTPIIVSIKDGHNIDVSYDITPALGYYTINIPELQVLGFQSLADQFLGQRRQADVSYALATQLDISSGVGWINATFTDKGGVTTKIYYYLYANNGTLNGAPQIINSAVSNGASGSANFQIFGAMGNSYMVTFIATQNGENKTYNKGYTFTGPSVLAGAFSPSWYFWIAFLWIAILYGAGVVTKKGIIGLIGIVGAFIFNIWGWFSLYISQIAMFGILGLLFLLSVIMIVLESERYK